ncbi:MAG: hypothetical protein K0R63_871 [Rickettsiales bacterium]|nr:hypothetical protein [Rickettsiales bacterium]
MMLHRKRGRPCLRRASRDLGTPELQEKRTQHITAEPLDFLHHKGLISSTQHQAGMRLRWLYSLRFGVPRVQAYNAEHIAGSSSSPYDPLWLAARNREYLLLCRILKEEGVEKTVSDVCIHLKSPLHIAPLERGLEALANYRKKGSARTRSHGMQAKA